ncbi:phosphatase PAP2 family protein [Metabacillus litoralis]|uniref:phosphatase PAP2 family protein n=1 Tax=Metabacillus litoralis TaxID=152268 RepID=UPI001CFD383E|nr:phosphatase PAP2 family protein [Metabacillus litoralis]
MDKKIFSFINRLAGKNMLIDRMMVYASNDLRYVYPFAMIILWIQNPKKTKAVFESFFSVLINVGLSLLFKKVKYVPRPFISRKANVLLTSKNDSSFISKHTILAYSVSTSIYLYNKVLGIFMYRLSALVGFSRVWTGVHYPYDILRSACIGSLVSVIVNRLLKSK